MNTTNTTNVRTLSASIYKPSEFCRCGRLKTNCKLYQQTLGLKPEDREEVLSGIVHPF